MLFLWIKALHIIAIIAWMAGLLYLPRLFVYHATADEKQAKTFQIMEHRLLRYIMNPAMIAAWVFGCWLVYLQPTYLHEGWMHTKFGFVLLLTAMHHVYAKWRKDFLAGKNERSPKTYKIANEVPTILMIGIVVMVVVRPF